jgi:hypothetical protein
MMEMEFHMSMMGELTFFLGIQVKQMKQGTFVHQANYTKDLMKKFNVVELKPVSMPMSMTTVDVSYAAPQVHGIVNIALHREYSLGIVFIFSHGRKDLYHI